MDNAVYQIKDWHKNFETERTATFKRRQQIDFSTDINDMILIWLLNEHENGPIHFAIWILLCEWYASTSPPRQGWITHNGKESGTPLTAKDLAIIIHMPENWVKEAFDRLSQPPINWITVERSRGTEYEQSMSSDNVASPTPSYPIPPNSIPPKEETLTAYEQKIETYFNTKIDNGIIKAWREAHTTIDVQAEILKAKAWLYANQDRKQYSRFGRFLANWMNNAANPPSWMQPKKSVMEMLEKIENEPKTTN